MSFIPHTEHDIKAMLQTIGVNSIEDLFDEIPESLKSFKLKNIADGLSEKDMLDLMQQHAQKNTKLNNFIGAGSYEHYIPAAVWDLASRGEFYSAYTPYQAEASQGTLQLLYEYQTMMASLMGMDAANASMYDGATALTEAILMAVRLHKQCKSKKILIAETIHPAYMQTVKTLVKGQGIEIEKLPLEVSQGRINRQDLPEIEENEVAAVVIPQPNFLGQLEAVNELTDWAHGFNALVIGVVHPIAMSVFTPPGEWGEKGADIACGEGQPLGVPVSAGGPYVGFLTCKQAHIRQMPGRIIGRTTDLDGRVGFALTLQAREQHIRRAKATSNICTNQSLLVTANCIFLSLMGYQGLRQIAHNSAAMLRTLVEKLCNEVKGVRLPFELKNSYCEAVIRLPIKARQCIQAMLAKGILAGFDLGQFDARLEYDLLICVTETKTQKQLFDYVQALKAVLEEEIK